MPGRSGTDPQPRGGAACKPAPVSTAQVLRLGNSAQTKLVACPVSDAKERSLFSVKVSQLRLWLVRSMLPSFTKAPCSSSVIYLGGAEFVKTYSCPLGKILSLLALVLLSRSQSVPMTCTLCMCLFSLT